MLITDELFDNVRERESHAKEKHADEIAKLTASEPITIDDDENTTAGNKNQNEAPAVSVTAGPSHGSKEVGGPTTKKGSHFREVGQVTFKGSKRKRSEEEEGQVLPPAKKQGLISNYFQRDKTSNTARRKSADQESGSALSGSIQSGSIHSGSSQSGSIQSGSVLSGSIQSGSSQSGSLQSGSISEEDVAGTSFQNRRDSTGSADDEYTRKIRQEIIRERSCKRCIRETGIFVPEGMCEHFTYKTPVVFVKDIQRLIVSVSENGSVGSSTPRQDM